MITKLHIAFGVFIVLFTLLFPIEGFCLLAFYGSVRLFYSLVIGLLTKSSPTPSGPSDPNFSANNDLSRIRYAEEMRMRKGQ